ncbi:MAG: BON domain-containing protein [Gammaproteobacteria bacterium]|nr:BON domain-containing protein [Gammaproteobacteria bacterium]
MSNHVRQFVVLLFAVTSVGLSGCTALLIGGAAAGGYMVANDDGSVGEFVDDTALTTSVKTRLISDKYVHGLRINVDSDRGIVTLRGEVNSFIERDRAIQIAESTKGVVRVDNELEVAAPKT